MVTERRYIPINHSDAGPAGGRRAADGPGTPGFGSGPVGGSAPAGSGNAAAAGAPANPGRASQAAAAAAGKAAGTGHGGGSGRSGHGASAAELQALTAERDALAVEREALVAERDAAVKERDDNADALLRLRAEFENYRRRTSREVIDAGTRAQCDLLGSLLPVLDNLDRALDAAEHHEEGKVLDGVRLTRKMFVDLLGCTGVEEIAGVGTQFDPNLHEAIMVQASDQEEGTVAAVLQKGYLQGDRVLRPAKVAVSSGKGEPAVAG
jgi:molecular chaperone GrpE